MRVTPGFPAAPGCPVGPGKTRTPPIVKELLILKSFLRGSRRCRSASICGLGIPCAHESGQTFELPLCAQRADGTPLRNLGFERIREALVFHSGDYDYTSDLATEYAQATIGKADGIIGQAWLTGIPALRCRRGQVGGRPLCGQRRA